MLMNRDALKRLRRSLLQWTAGLLLGTVIAAQAQPPVASGAADAPVIDSIKFSGNTKLSDDQLGKTVQLKVGATLSREKMKADLDRIVAAYRKAGYDLSVSPDIAHPAAGHVAITFKIDESGTAGDAGPAAAAPGGGAGGPSQ